MTWETVIGLETHAELATRTKIFCSCTTRFGGEPNTHCCPICTGMPGTLPMVNRKVVEYACRAGLALNCEITRRSRFDRKNYFYPDLPKAYQVSQLYLPIARNGACEHRHGGGGEGGPHPRAAHGGGRGQAGPRPLAGPDPGGLQPLRRAADRDRHRARLPLRRGGDRLSGEAEVHPGVSGDLGLQDAGGLPALRREPLRPARGLPGAWAPARR